MEPYKVEKGLRATLVVTPEYGGKGSSRVIDGLSAIRSFLDGLAAPAVPALGTKENPFREDYPKPHSGTLYPRVLNDYSLSKEFRDAAASTFNNKDKNTYVEVLGPVQETLVQDPEKGTYHIEPRVLVMTIYWNGDRSLSALVKVRDLTGEDLDPLQERKAYRRWKDAQLKEAKNLTRKRIMKALAGSEGAQFKFGDKVVEDDGTVYDFIGYTVTGWLILLENNKVVYSRMPNLYRKANSKEGNQHVGTETSTNQFMDRIPWL